MNFWSPAQNLTCHQLRGVASGPCCTTGYAERTYNRSHYRHRDRRLADACHLVTNDLTQPRSMDWLAHAVGTSERTLTRLFRTEFGTTYPQWRTQIRVFRALVHLADGATVTETAHRFGWATSSAFIDTFTRTMGQTPGAYRTAATRAQIA